MTTRRLVMITALAVMAACALGAAPPAPPAPPAWRFSRSAKIGKLSRGLCEGCKADRDADYCRDFTLTTEQVRELLSRAEPITQQQFTQYYQFAPCVVRGTATWHRTKIRFEISAFLIATVWREDGTMQLLACTGDCEEAVLGPGARTPVQR